MVLSTALFHAIAYVICFFAVWWGAGQVVSMVSKLSRSWRLPAFTVSFFLLGILTSLPEITIGTISLINNDPAIYAGNLLGGIIIIFLGIIPLLGILGNGVKIPAQLDQQEILYILIVAIAPSILTLDRKITNVEGVLFIVLYVSMFGFFSFKQSLMEKVKANFSQRKKFNPAKLWRVLIGVVVLLVASQQIVNSTMYFADVLKVSPFFVSLIIVSIGTNIPEISLVVRSIMHNKKEIAFADYLGSATANTFLLGIFTLLNTQPLELPNHLLQRFLFLGTSLIIFFFFAKSKRVISRRESFVLFGCYLLFFAFEIFMLLVEIT